MFKGHLVYIYNFPGAEALRLVTQAHGARLAETPGDPALTLAVTCSIAHIPMEMHAFRQRQIPVVSSAWLTESVQLGAPVPLSSARSTLFHPHMFLGIVATSSQLEWHVKCNVRAALEFFGGAYRRDFTEDCNLVISDMAGLAGSTDTYADAADPLARCRTPPKLQVARERRVRCESVAWLQRCVDRGVLCAFTQHPDNRRGAAEDATGSSSVPMTAHLHKQDDGDTCGDSVERNRRPNGEAEMVVATINVAGASAVASLAATRTSPVLITGAARLRKRPRASTSSASAIDPVAPVPPTGVENVCHLSLHPAAYGRSVTRGLARELERQAQLRLVTNSGPMTRNKTAVLHDLLQRISPKK